MDNVRRRKKDGGQIHKKSGQVVENNAVTRQNWWIFVVILLGILVAPIIILIILPCHIDAQIISMPEPPVLEGVLAPNDLLTKAEHIYKDSVLGPESLVVHQDDLYCGTSDGRVVKLSQGNVTTLAQFGTHPCYDEETCGRPLGMRLDPVTSTLYVLDGYFGLYAINIDSGESRVLWPASAPINGKLAMLFNDLVLSSDKKIYFTHSSAKWQRKDFILIAMEGEPTGRLIEYDITRNTTKELMSRLLFANGVQLSPDESFILVAECITNRIWKYHLKGDKRGQSEIFADSLPGLPDNIRPSSTGGYWVGLSTLSHKHSFSLMHFLADKPWIRNILSKLGAQFITSLVPRYGLIIELDQSGKVVRSLHDPTGVVVSSASEVADTGSHLYIGSYHLPFISKVTL